MITAIDLFAGAGGFTEGATQAGVKVLWAANHWQAAVDTHALNHPEVQHLCQDLRQANFYDLPHFNVLLASPSCTGHSRARGRNRPKHQGDRNTAWAIIDCVEAKQPELVVCENVTEWVKGWLLWPAWVAAMRALGYSVSPNVVNSADYGVPQDRERVMVICTRSLNPLMLRTRRARHRPASQFVRWDGPGWREIDGKLAANTQRRIAHGREHFGGRFCFSYYGNTSTARDLARPIGTITTKDRWAVVDGDRMRMLDVAECRAAMGFPDDYQLPASTTLAKHMLGNAVCPPMVREVLREVLAA